MAEKNDVDPASNGTHLAAAPYQNSNERSTRNSNTTTPGVSEGEITTANPPSSVAGELNGQEVTVGDEIIKDRAPDLNLPVPPPAGEVNANSTPARSLRKRKARSPWRFQDSHVYGVKNNETLIQFYSGLDEAEAHMILETPNNRKESKSRTVLGIISPNSVSGKPGEAQCSPRCGRRLWNGWRRMIGR